MALKVGDKVRHRYSSPGTFGYDDGFVVSIDSKKRQAYVSWRIAKQGYTEQLEDLELVPTPKPSIAEPKIKHTWRTIEDPEIQTTAALDAVAEGRPDAYKLFPGMPATISIGSDRYAAAVVSASPSLHTITAKYTDRGSKGDKPLTFRRAKDGVYRTPKRIRLSFGHAETHLDPSR